jgi:hypothetical protein
MLARNAAGLEAGECGAIDSKQAKAPLLKVSAPKHINSRSTRYGCLLPPVTENAGVTEMPACQNPLRLPFLPRLLGLLPFGLWRGRRAIAFEQQPKQLICAPHLFVRLRLRFGESD